MKFSVFNYNFMGFCKYRDIFGKPNTGSHSLRIFDIALIDVLETGLVAWVISYYTSRSFLPVLGMLFFLGVLLHRVFCVKTKIDRFLDKIFFPSRDQNEP